MANDLLFVEDRFSECCKKQPATAPPYKKRFSSKGRWTWYGCGSFCRLCDLVLSAYH